MTNPNAGKASPSPNPPRSWVKCRGRRRGLRGPAALEGPAGAARSPGRRRELGRASDPTGQTPGRVTARRVPVQLPGPLGGPAGAAYLDGCAGPRARGWAGRATRRTGLRSGSGRQPLEEVVSARPFPRSAQTWSARRAAPHRGARRAPGWRHTHGCG